MVIDGDVVLDGEGKLAVDGPEELYTFHVASPVNAELSGVSGNGVGIDNSDGRMTVTNSFVSENSRGGSLLLTNSTVSGNERHHGGATAKTVTVSECKCSPLRNGERLHSWWDDVPLAGGGRGNP